MLIRGTITWQYAWVSMYSNQIHQTSAQCPYIRFPYWHTEVAKVVLHDHASLCMPLLSWLLPLLSLRNRFPIVSRMLADRLPLGGLSSKTSSVVLVCFKGDDSVTASSPDAPFDPLLDRDFLILDSVGRRGNFLTAEDLRL